MGRLLALMFSALILGLSGSRPALATSAPFIVYFPHNSTRIETDALAVIECAAKAMGEFKIAIHAGADRSGPADYNLELSRRRGLAVKAALIRWGLPREHVKVEGFGEARPLMETQDGVQERRNRYVVIEVLEHVGPVRRHNATTPRCPLAKSSPRPSPGSER